MTNHRDICDAMKDHNTCNEIYNHIGITSSRKKGNAYEAIIRIIVAMGLFTNHKTYRLFELLNRKRINTETLLVTSIYSVDESVRGKGGDMRLYDEAKSTTVIVQVKNYKKNIQWNEISSDVAYMLETNPHHIVLVLNDIPTKDFRRKVDLKCKKAHTKCMYFSCRDIDDILSGITSDDIDLFCKGDMKDLTLQFHQQYIVNKCIELIDNDEKRIVIGAKPRAGKSYMIGGLIERKQYGKVCIFTPIPKETKEGWTDVFSMAPFINYNVYTQESSKTLSSETYDEDHILICSKQLLDHDFVINQKYDLICIDEAHLVATHLTQKIVDKMSHENTILILISGTYIKAVAFWDVPKRCVLKWEYRDEQDVKQQNTKQLFERYPNIQKLWTKTTSEEYKNMPQMVLQTGYPCHDVFDKLRSTIISGCDTYLDFKLLLALDKKGSFVEQTAVGIFLNSIFGVQPHRKQKTLIGEIEKFQRQANETMFSNLEHNTILVFLPCGGKGTKVNRLANGLRPMIEELDICKKLGYHIESLANKESKNYKKTIETWEHEHKKLIILTGRKLSLGISLPNVNYVILMNNSHSSDLLQQQIFRAMTPSHEKTYGYIIDPNPYRSVYQCLNILNSSNIVSNSVLLNDVFTSRHILLDPATYYCDGNVDNDKMTKYKEALIEYVDNNPLCGFNMSMERIQHCLFTVNDKAQVILNALKKLQKASASKLVLEKTKLGDEDEIKVSSGCKSSPKDDVINFVRDILPFVVQVVCLLSVNSDLQLDFKNLLIWIDSNPELKEVFTTRMNMLWGDRLKETSFLDSLITLLDNNDIRQDTSIDDIIVDIRLRIKSCLDKPDKALEVINKYLTPSEYDKKTFGEVFTPMNTINEMLDKLPVHVWTNTKLKWLDPANGMGNFVVAIYLRLMEGLKNRIPDVKSRKKHILGKMIYVGELNPLNSFIYKLLVDPANQYKLNIHQGDSLAVDISNFFDVKFNIVVGNPPYNQELKKTGALPLYNLFIEKYIDRCDILQFIVPSRWFAGGKGLDKFRRSMLSRTDIVYIRHINDASSVFGKHVDIKGGVNHFMKDSDHDGHCKYNGVDIDLCDYNTLYDPVYISLVNHMKKYVEKYGCMADKIYRSQDFYNLQTNDKRLEDDGNEMTHYKCYVSKQKGFEKWISKECVNKDTTSWKVITTEASYEQGSGFGNIFIGKPNEVHTKTYISFNVSNESEAKSFESFLHCKLVNVLLSLKKISQHTSEKTLSFIPKVSLNHKWTDEKLFKRFKLPSNLQELVMNSNIVGFKSN